MKTSIDDWGTVGVLMGGWSAEREISIQSGETVQSTLDQAGIKTTVINLQRENIAESISAIMTCDRIFNIMHGGEGENGCIQGLLKTLGIPCTGSSVAASAISMDKILTKKQWMRDGLLTPNCVEIREEQDCSADSFPMEFPVMVKPASGGSSLGAHKVENHGELQDAWLDAKRYGQGVMAEQWKYGKEYAAGFIGNMLLPPVRLSVAENRAFYDFKAKYHDDSTQLICPCGLNPSAIEEMQEISRHAFSSLGVSGWGRADLIRDEHGQNWLLEVNSVPGLTAHSLIPKSAKELGMNLQDILILILKETIPSDQTSPSE